MSGFSSIVPITNALLATMTDATTKGRALGAGTGAATDLTAAQIAAVVGSVGGALNSSVLTLPTRDLTTATGSIGYTGLGISPTCLLAWASTGAGVASDYVCWSFASATRSARCLTLFGAAWNLTSTAFLLIGDATGTNYQTATITSYDADGFTLSWTKVGSPTGTATITVLGLR